MALGQLQHRDLDASYHRGPGSSVGWLQAMSLNKWAIYKDVAPADGSVWLQKGTPTSALVTVNAKPEGDRQESDGWPTWPVRR